MGMGDRSLCCLLVVCVAFGTVNSVHRNTVDVTRSRSTVVQQRTILLNPGRSRATSGFSQPRRRVPPSRREPVGTDINVIERPGTRHSAVHSTLSKNAHVDLPGEHGNHSPYAIVHRERGTNSRSDGSRGSDNKDTEPPVIFLNRERIRRRNRLRAENRRLNPAPSDVEPSTFERGTNPSPMGRFPFPDSHGKRSPPSTDIYNRPISNNGGLTGMTPPPYNDQSMFSRGYFPPMTSFPDRMGPFPYPGQPPVNNMQVPRDYERLMTSVDEMLDALPIPMRRMLRRRRRMRRLGRLRRFGMLQNFPPYNRYPMF